MFAAVPLAAAGGVAVRAADGAFTTLLDAVGAGVLAATAVLRAALFLLLLGGVGTDGNWLCTTGGEDFTGFGCGFGTPGPAVTGGLGAVGGFTEGGLG